MTKYQFIDKILKDAPKSSRSDLLNDALECKIIKLDDFITLCMDYGIINDETWVTGHSKLSHIL